MKDNENMNARYRAERMKVLLTTHDGKIDLQIMQKIASDHGEAETQNHKKSICQHTSFPGYNVKTLVSFLAQPREKRFWYCEGNPCKNQFEEAGFER